MADYPRLVINKQKLLENINQMVKLCGEKGIMVSGAVKGFNGLPELVRVYDGSDCAHIGDSRMTRLKQYRQMGIQKPLLLLRLPQMCEISDLVRYCDISLNSEYETVCAINAQAKMAGVTHEVILMVDLGDLREGIFDEEEAVAMAIKIEKELEHVVLKGIGTNLGCYGAVKPTETNIGRLVGIARRIESEIGRKLELISAGATSSVPLALSGNMPEGANHLRVGEDILLAEDLDKIWNKKTPGMHQDAFVLEAQVIEVRDKPSHPVGEMFVDAFGKEPTFEDIGTRKKALVALGKQDVGQALDIAPLLPGIRILGGSSDHLILDVEECAETIKVGSVIRFEVFYGGVVFTTSYQNVHKYYI